MPSAHLTDRALVEITGPDAEHFLQNVVTLDLDSLAEGEARPGALLSPQGKILFDFLASRIPDGLLLDTPAAVADDLVRRLTLYRLRAKAQISKRDQSLVTVVWTADSSASPIESTGLADRRFTTPAEAFRSYDAGSEASASEADWHAFRIAEGVPEGGRDYAFGDAFPHDALLDQTGGVGFRKGCYVGQEVVSRMQHRGTARRRALVLTAADDLPAPGAEVTAGGRSIGTLGSTAGRHGLAILRIDRVKDAMDEGLPILAGDMPVEAAIPRFARFAFPQATAGDA